MSGLAADNLSPNYMSCTSSTMNCESTSKLSDAEATTRIRPSRRGATSHQLNRWTHRRNRKLKTRNDSSRKWQWQIIQNVAQVAHAPPSASYKSPRMFEPGASRLTPRPSRAKRTFYTLPSQSWCMRTTSSPNASTCRASCSTSHCKTNSGTERDLTLDFADAFAVLAAVCTAAIPQCWSAWF